MPPIKNRTGARKHFIYDSDENVSKCTLCAELEEPVTYTIKGDHLGNQERHLKRNHKKEFDKLKKNSSGTSVTQTNITSYGEYKVLRKKIFISVDSDIIEKTVLKLVTVDGRPFLATEDESFKSIINPIKAGLGINKKIDRKFAKELLTRKASDLRAKISQLLKNQFICLKLDGGQVNQRKFMGVNLQFRDHDFNFRTFNLGCVELNQPENGEYLKKEVTNLLKKNEIDQSRIYAVCTDNGRNYMRCVKLLRKAHCIIEADCATREEEEFDDIFCVDELEATEDDDKYIDELINQCVDQLHFTHICCIEHTFQLGIKKFVDQNETFSEAVSKMKAIIIKLRTTSMRNILRNNYSFKKHMLIDVETRWGSLYLMIRRFLEAEAIVKLMIEDSYFDSSSNLTDTDWDSIKRLFKLLTPCYEATVLFQTRNAILTELYKFWVDCDVALELLENEGIPEAKTLRARLEERHADLFDNTCFKTAIFLDPRFRTTLSAVQIEVVKQHIFNLTETFPVVDDAQENDLDLDEDEDEPNLSIPSSSNSKKQPAPLKPSDKKKISADQEKARKVRDAALISRIKKQSKVASAPTLQLRDENFEDEVQEYMDSTIMLVTAHQSEVLKFWKTNTFSRRLKHAVSLVYSVPGTQVSVECLFSDLKLVVNDHRGSMNAESVEDSLYVRRNFELLYNE